MSGRPRLPRLGRAAAVVVAAAALAGCTSPAAPPAPQPLPSVSRSVGATPGTPTRTVDTTLQVPASLANGPFSSTRTVTAPAGWTVSVWGRVDGARLAAWTPDGRLLVSRPSAGDVQVLTPRGTGVPTTTTLVSGLTQPHGLAFDGDTLYVGESNRIDAYRYADGTASDRRTVVAGLPDASTPELRGAYAHALKSVAVGPDHSVYFSIGSSGNIVPEDRTATPERATIMHVVDGKAQVFARGVRNGTGLAFAPDGSLWTAVNDRDQTPYPYDRDYDGNGSKDRGAVIADYVGDHPLEEVAKLTRGRDLGWPFCNPDPDVQPGVKGTAFDYTDRPFVRDQDTNADGSKLDCGALPRVEAGLPAHSAPLGLAFATAAETPSGWGAGALIGVHGSWNRTPPRAPSVAFLPWSGSTLGAPRTLLGGFQLADGSRWGRPVAAVPGPDGAIYVTDDAAGAVYRLQPAS